ncbi:GntR family transcriptional regulator [Streptococcus sp. H49]|uniref:GntR family transcriptional regulator n=1 Tax=Streptococcus huangxiaojuni TaxID=3237239 RepID=UPI0034A45605
MKLNRESLVPLYEQIKDSIRKNIQNNNWKKGTKIPSENSLMKDLGVSRGTIRKAILELVDEGVLVQKQGLGTFVSSENFAIPLTEGLHSFYEHMKSQNISFETTILNKEIQVANDEIIRLMKLKPGSAVFFLERIRTIDDEVVMLIQNYINLLLAPNIMSEDFINNGLFNIIERQTKKRVAYSETRFAAVESDQTQSKYFKIKSGSPLLFQEQLVHLDDTSIIELGRVWLKSNRFYIGTTMRRTY